MERIVRIPLPGRKLPTNADSQGSWDHFLAGPENPLVAVAVEAVLAETDPEYNPIVLYGPPGTGKTHVALGLAAAWKVKFPRRRVRCKASGDFARDLTEAFETNALDDFRRNYRGAWLFVLDDVHHLQNKKYAQTELVATLDELIEAQRRVVITSRFVPGEIAGVSSALRSRLSGGLVVPLVSPGLATREAILERLAALRGLPLSKEGVEALAGGLATTPELIGAVGDLLLRKRIAGGKMDTRAIRAYLHERIGLRPEPSLEEIAKAAAKTFSVPMKELRGPSRRRSVVTARGAAMYLARQLTARSLEQIGRHFGGRDHTTVLHGCRKTEQLLRTEGEIRKSVNEIRQRLSDAPVRARTSQ